MLITDEERQAWKVCQDAWIAAGARSPCDDPKYLSAREQFYQVLDRVRPQANNEPGTGVPARRTLYIAK